MWIKVLWTCLQNIFQLFKAMCYQLFRKESTLFTTKTCFSTFSNEFSQHYWQESFDGDSFLSQSRMDAYVVHMSPLTEAAHLARSCLTLNSHTKCAFCSYDRAVTTIFILGGRALTTIFIFWGALKSLSEEASPWLRRRSWENFTIFKRLNTL